MPQQIEITLTIEPVVSFPPDEDPVTINQPNVEKPTAEEPDLND